MTSFWEDPTDWLAEQDEASRQADVDEMLWHREELEREARSVDPPARMSAHIEAIGVCCWKATLNGRLVPAPAGGFLTVDDAQAAVTVAMRDWYGLIPTEAPHGA